MTSKWMNFRVVRLARYCMGLIPFLLSACLPTNATTPFPSVTPTPIDTATPTVIWFPATETPTLGPTIQPSPTPELLTGVGELFFEDQFELPTDWALLQTANSNISVGNNELTLALSQEKGYLFSIREGALFSNFYAELTASPNLCNGFDEYGMLIRYQSPGNFYRFSLSCNGQVRLDRVVNGVASSPQAWMVSSTVPSAAPSSSRLGVWAIGKEMRFFINEQFQFSVSDPSLPSGALGAFVRSASDTAVTVSFSELTVYTVEQ